MDRSPRFFLQKSKVFGKHRVKQNKPNGQMPIAPEGGYKLYGGRSRLANNPLKVCAGKRKTK